MGRIWLDSDLGEGSTFHFVIPFEYGKDQKVSLEQLPDLAGLRALLVDDNETNLHILQETLEGWGMTVNTATSAASAIRQLTEISAQSVPLPLLISDVHMPEMDGFQLVELLRDHESFSDIAIILLTSGGRVGDVARSKKLGVSSYLIKPAKQSELLSAILMSGRDLETIQKEPDPASANGELSLPRMKILLAEDGIANQKVAVGLLATWDHDVTVAVNGIEAVRLWQSGEFDLILMDIQMPLMNGIEATRQIRELEVGTGRHTPIIAMTAHAMKGDRARCLESGMDDYLSKPVRKPELHRALSVVAGQGINKTSTEKPMSQETNPAEGNGKAKNDDDQLVIDWEAAMANVADDRELFVAVKDSALEEIPALLPKLVDVIETGDAAEAQRLAHTIKGAARVIAANKTMVVSERIEHAARRGDLDEARGSLQELREVIEELVETLNRSETPEPRAESLALPSESR